MEELKHKMLTVVELLRLHPTELMKFMRGEADAAVRDACLALMNEGKLVLSNDRYWEIPSKF